MEDNDYTVDAFEKNRQKINWKPFLRQLLVCTSVWTSYFVNGLCTGAPTMFIPQIRREANSTDVISDEMASWLSSVVSFSGFPCVVILTIFSRLFGRKKCFAIAIITSFAAFLLFYCSTNVTQILISEIMQGLFSAAQIIISVLVITEYTSPKYRGLFLTLKCATNFWGVWTANIIGTFFHWKNIGLIALLCLVYTLGTLFFWPESPYWLASRARYKECAATHRWLKGCDEASEKELESIINTQKEYIKSQKEKPSAVETIKNWYTTITSKEFYKPTLIAMASGALGIFTGKLVCTVYAIDIIKKITDSESTAYTGMLVLDGVTILGMYTGCFLAKFIKRRAMFLVSSLISAIFLFIFSFYLYLIHLSIISERKYISLGLLVLISIAVTCGPLLMATSVYGELIPVRSRNLSACIIALIGKCQIGGMLKTAPLIFSTFGTHGAFFFFGLSSSICLVFLYKYLPETKDKTLQEIADGLNGVSSKNRHDKATVSLVS